MWIKVSFDEAGQYTGVFTPHDFELFNTKDVKRIIGREEPEPEKKRQREYHVIAVLENKEIRLTGITQGKNESNDDFNYRVCCLEDWIMEKFEASDINEDYYNSIGKDIE